MTAGETPVADARLAGRTGAAYGIGAAGRAAAADLAEGRTLVKICGLMRPEDADALNAAQPDFAGFILSAGFRRSIDRGQAQAISARLNPTIVPVGVFVDDDLQVIADFVNEGIIRVVQLHGSEDEAYLASLRELLPDTPIVKAFKVREAADVKRANASSADWVLLDNGQGTGEAFDWSVLAAAKRPYLLAGGLGPGNVERAVRELHPRAVDMSSGVETDGRKDPEKIAQAVASVRKADAHLQGADIR